MLVCPLANVKSLQTRWIQKSCSKGPAAAVTQEVPTSHVFWTASPIKVLDQIFYSNRT